MLQTSSDSGNIPVLPEIEVAGSIASVRTGADWQPGSLAFVTLAGWFAG